MDNTFCLIRNYGKDNEEVVAEGLGELEMLMRIKEELKEEDDKLTVCLENATQEEADCWCRTTVNQYGNTCVRIGSVGTLNL